MIVTDEMIEAGLVAFLKAMGIKYPVSDYHETIQRGWRFQVRTTLEAALAAHTAPESKS